MTKKFNKEQKAEWKAKKAAETKDLLAKIEAGVERITTGAEWKAFLDFKSKFHNYSFNNQCLIYLHNPNASHVAGYKAWQKLGRQVKKGEKGIRILAPAPMKIEDKKTGEEKLVYCRFKAVSVFDISQTEGDDLPSGSFASAVEGDSVSATVRSGLVDFANDLGFSVEFNSEMDEHPGANGVCKFKAKEIEIANGLDADHEIKTLIHEIGHAVMHSGYNKEFGELHSIASAEVEAESVAFCVSNIIGLDTGCYSFGYVAGWSGGDVEKIRESGDRITKCVAQIASAIAA